MHAPTAPDVDHAHLEEEALVGPQPVGGHAVDDGVDQGEEAVRVEVAPERERGICVSLLSFAALAEETVGYRAKKRLFGILFVSLAVLNLASRDLEPWLYD